MPSKNESIDIGMIVDLFVEHPSIRIQAIFQKIITQIFGQIEIWRIPEATLKYINLLFKQWYQFLYFLLGITNPLNHKVNVQQQIITILLKFFETDQPQVCDSQTLCEMIIDYLKFVFRQPINEEYFQMQLLNLINIIFWKKKIYQIPCIEINELEIADSHLKPNLRASLLQAQIYYSSSNKTLQQLLRERLLQYSELQECLLTLPQPEVSSLVLELSTFYFSFPSQLLNGKIMVENKLLLLPFQQQIQFFLQLQQLDNEKLDIITQLIFQNGNIDISEFVPQFIYIFINTKVLDYDRATILLKKIARNKKYELNYELLRQTLILSSDKLLNNFILDAIQYFEINQEIIVKQEIAKYSNPINVTHLVIQLLTADHFEYLFEKLINKSISPYQYVLLHIITIIQEKHLALHSLQEQCLRFTLNEISLVQIFSLYSFSNLNLKRKMKLLTQFQQLIDTESNISFYDVLSIIGQDTTQSPLLNQKIGSILNREWNNISNFLKQITYKKQAQIIQGFYYVVMYFTDQNESEFLRLFDIVHKSMCTRNKVVNYNMLITAIQHYEQGRIESEIQLYVMLLKINYLLTDNTLHKKKQAEEISERSSELGDLNEEQENAFFSQIQEHGIKLIQQFDKKIKLYEMTYLGREEKVQAAIEISRLLLLSDVKINVIHSLIRDEKALNLLHEPNLIESDVIWESLKKCQLVSLATSIIQIFKNEKNIKLIKMMILELSKLCKYRFYPLLWKQYDILYIQSNQLQPITKINTLSMIVQKYQQILQIEDNYEFLKLSYQQVQKSQLEQIGLLIGISLYCGISSTLIEGLGIASDCCINKLIVQFSNAGLLHLVLTLVKPVKQQRKKKNSMDVEKKLEDYLNNQLQEVISIVLIGIQKNLNKNSDLRQEFINLATKVYQFGQSTDYPLIFDLFEKIPPELVLRCLHSICDSDPNQDLKLQHILNLLSKIDKFIFPAEFYELSYQVVIKSEQITQTMIDYCFQLINMIKMNETGQQLQANIDVQQLKDHLIPEGFVPTGCTQQNTQQQIYTCIQCQTANKRNVQCCASCAFSCHSGHQIQYDLLQEASCECNLSRKCTQQRQRQYNPHQALRRDILSHPMIGGSGVLDFIRQERELSQYRDFREFHDLELNPHLSEYRSILREQALQQELDSEVDLEDSPSSSQLQLHEESNEIIEKSQSSNSIIEIEQNQFEGKYEKQQISVVQVSNFFENFDINFQLLYDKLIKMCQFALSQCSNEDHSKSLLIEEQQEFQISSRIQYKIEKVTYFTQQSNIVQLKTEPIDIFNEIRKSQETVRRQLQNSRYYYLPFQLRKLIDEGEGFIAVASSNEIKIFQKQKFLAIAEKKNTGLQLPNQVINCRFSVSTVIFNQQNQRQLVACGLQEIHFMELKPDGTLSSDKVLVSRFQHPISKTVWINSTTVGWLACHSIYVHNISASSQSQYHLDMEDKIKDFCVVGKFILCIEFEGDIYYCRIQDGQSKNKITEKASLNDQLKGKSKDKIPYCLTVIPNTQIILISYKNAASILCNFENQQFSNIVRLDEQLASQSLDGLLSSPQLISQNKQTLKFSVLAQKQSFTNQQLNFHQGKVLVIEINSKGDILVQQIFETQVEGYSLVRNAELNCFALALQDNKQLISAILNVKDSAQQFYIDKKSENQDQLLNQMKERFDLNLLKQAQSVFLPLQHFCLPPSILATPQQLQVGTTSITVTQGFAITGIVFNSPTVDSIEIFKYRTIHKRNGSIIIPFNYLEQLYTFLHHTVSFTQNNYNSAQVYIQKMTMSQALMVKLLQILSQENNSQKNYIFQDIKSRYSKLRSFITEPLICLVNSIDCLGITLQAYSNPTISYSIIPSLIKIIENNQPIISESAKKLLKIILKNNKTILGGEYDYKSIKDRIFIQRIKKNFSDGAIPILQKLYKISIARLPQLFYIFNQIPNIIFDILVETTTYKTYVAILLRYLQFLLNCKKNIGSTLQQIEELKQQWKLPNQNLYNQTLIDELLLFQKSSTREVVNYAWDVFPQDQQIQLERIEIEQSDGSIKSSPYVDFNIDDIANDYGDELDINGVLLRQENAFQRLQNKSFSKKKETVLLQFQQPKPSLLLTIESFDIVREYVKWLSQGIMDFGDTFGKKELQSLIQLIKQMYTVTKASKNIEIIKEYFGMVDIKNKGIQSVFLLSFINGKNTNDDLWNAFNRHSIFMNLQEVYDILKGLNLTDSQSRGKQKVLPFDKFRDILKSYNESQYQLLLLLLERKNQLFYLQILKYLLGAVKINTAFREAMQTNQWTELICQGKLNPQLKSFASSYQKQLLQQIIAKQDYHKIKDINLYKTQIYELQRDQSHYGDRQQTYQALERIHKACKKRPDIWKQYCDEGVLKVIKSHIRAFPKETLEIIEVII